MSLAQQQSRELLDITSVAFRADAHLRYARLRQEAPVAPVVLPGGRQCWLVSRYEDVEAGLKDDRLVKDPRQIDPGWAPDWLLRLNPLHALERNMLDLNPPDHTRLRKLVHRAFTPRRVAALEARIRSLADELLSRGLSAGRMELVSEYALPIPVTIICELLGIPAADHARVHRWTQMMVTATPTASSLRILPSMVGFVRYLRAVVEDKRRHPDDALISALVVTGEDGDALSADELLAMIVLLVVAGHETTVNLIANGTLALLEHPEQLQRLRAEPERMGTAIDELLRFYTPVEVATERYAREPLVLRGVEIPRGGMVCLSLGSANRDPCVFERPDELDVARPKNKHLAFGDGRHFCTGSILARLEGAIALGELVRRSPRLALASSGPVRWRPGLNLRGLEALHVLC